MNSDLNGEKSCEVKSISRSNSVSLYPPPRPPRHRRLSSEGHAVDKLEQRRSGNQARMFTGRSLQESLLMRSASHSQDQYYLISDAMNSNNNRNQFITDQLYQVRTDEYASVKVSKKRISSGSCKYSMFVVVLVNIAVITCLVILIQLFSDWRGGDMDLQKSLRMRGFADRILREAKFRSVANFLHLKNTDQP